MSCIFAYIGVAFRGKCRLCRHIYHIYIYITIEHIQYKYIYIHGVSGILCSILLDSFSESTTEFGSR